MFIQDVNPGAFAAGITLLTGVPEVIISCVKAALFGLIAGLVACYRGLTITGGGAKAVGNAVNETVVYRVHGAVRDQRGRDGHRHPDDDGYEAMGTMAILKCDLSAASRGQCSRRSMC